LLFTIKTLIQHRDLVGFVLGWASLAWQRADHEQLPDLARCSPLPLLCWLGGLHKSQSPASSVTHTSALTLHIKTHTGGFEAAFSAQQWLGCWGHILAGPHLWRTWFYRRWL